MTARPGGPADVLRVLVLLQIAAGLLAMLGEVVLMGGNPLYVVLPVVKAVALLVLAAKVAGGRGWAMFAMLTGQLVSIFGFWLNQPLGLLPGIDVTVTLVGLLMNLGLPAAIAAICLLLLARRGAARRPAIRPTAPPPYRPGPPYQPAPSYRAGPAVDPWPRETLTGHVPAVGPGVGR